MLYRDRSNIAAKLLTAAPLACVPSEDVMGMTVNWILGLVREHNDAAVLSLVV